MILWFWIKSIPADLNTSNLFSYHFTSPSVLVLWSKARTKIQELHQGQDCHELQQSTEPSWEIPPQSSPAGSLWLGFSAVLVLCRPPSILKQFVLITGNFSYLRQSSPHCPHFAIKKVIFRGIWEHLCFFFISIRTNFIVEAVARSAPVLDTERADWIQKTPQSVELGSKTSEFLPSLTSVELFKTLLVSMSLKNALANSVPAKQWVGLAHLRALILLERSCIYWADFSGQSVKTLDIKVLSCELHLALLLLS